MAIFPSVIDNQTFAKRDDTQNVKKLPTWGRNNYVTFLNWIAVVSLLFLTPLLQFYFVFSMQEADGSLTQPLLDFLKGRPLASYWIPNTTKLIKAAKLYTFWTVFQILCALFVPGRTGFGQVTPAGHKLKYKVNGLNCYLLTLLVFFAGSYFNFWAPTIIYDYWIELSVCMQVHGFLLALFAYLKAKYYSSHPEDNKISNSVLYDFFLGVELNPRIGDFDFKLFYNGRIGIILWTLVNLSCAARQYQLYGALTNSMVLLNIGQAVYVADFFFHEDWYLRTIDICHDHFGYYLAWGDTAWLPIMYALQAPFLVRHPRVLSTVECFLISLLFSLGYLIFRSANNQKDKFRATEGKAFFFNQKPTFINANYVTADGKQRERRAILITLLI
ncbi:7-dehydrocholesterol reductase-like isoform X2 [Zophobas morio]|uniref:7-dehydrocholesterol reductase-like isoform X2 n=1 Tax=Zophobas morio TaxID=2755281 RepID=UPI003083EA64